MIEIKAESSAMLLSKDYEDKLNPIIRRKLGMHYTSIETIHKVIDNLFLNDLKAELDRIKRLTDNKVKYNELKKFQNKLSSLKFLDPACGSGNFLIETYISLREIENEIIKLMMNEIQTEDVLTIKVSISQFYGIEINSSAVLVARKAMREAEMLMFKDTEGFVPNSLYFKPSEIKITEGNSLRLNWESIVSKTELSYIIGNPPFIGHQWRNKEQIDDMKIVFNDLRNHGRLDYVTAWFNKAIDFMKGTTIQTAFVATNSICQGESVRVLWKDFFEKKGVEIQFAYQSFLWDSEIKNKARVYCIIVGFSCYHIEGMKKLYTSSRMIETKHINGYLLATSDIYLKARGININGLPNIFQGNKPWDGGYLCLSFEEKQQLVSKYPKTKSFIKLFLGSDEFLNNKKRYCLWLKDVPLQEYENIVEIQERLKGVERVRKETKTLAVQKQANTPTLFSQIRQPNTTYLVIPEVSSNKRQYIPIGYLSPNIICSNKLYVIPNASLFLFGVLVSNVHMAWMRVVSGRLGMGYSYSPSVYNNFPMCEATEEQKIEIEKSAQRILDIRKKYINRSLAELYNVNTMPIDLLQAHKENDKVVMCAYGIKQGFNEEDIVSFLFNRYQEIIRK